MNDNLTERVEISYDIEDKGGKKKKKLPFVVGVIGDFLGNYSPTLEKDPNLQRFIEINDSNFSEIMAALSPGLQFHIQLKGNQINKPTQVKLIFREMSDFEPLSIIQQIPELKLLFEKRQALKKKLEEYPC